MMRMEILQALALREGERVLEIGSGPGLLAQAVGRAVGPDGRVVGIEINPGLVKSSKALCADLPWVDIGSGDIRNGLPFPDGEFDAVTAASVLQYITDADLDAVLAEVQGRRYFQPSTEGQEKEIKERLEGWWGEDSSGDSS